MMLFDLQKNYKQIFFFSLISLCLTCFSVIEKQDEQQRKQEFRKRKIKKDATITMHSEEKLVYELTYKELEDKKNKLKLAENFDAAIKIVEQMLPLCADMEALATLILELADMSYDVKKYDIALTTYKNFTIHYEGHQKFEYALYKMILSASRLLLHFDRDQSKTEETLVLVNKYLSFDEFIVYKAEVERIKHDCLTRFFLSELYNIEFYAKSGKLSVAKERLKLLKRNEDFQAIDSYFSEIERIELFFLERDTTKQYDEEFLRADDSQDIKNIWL